MKLYFCQNHYDMILDFMVERTVPEPMLD